MNIKKFAPHPGWILFALTIFIGPCIFGGDEVPYSKKVIDLSLTIAIGCGVVLALFSIAWIMEKYDEWRNKP